MIKILIFEDSAKFRSSLEKVLGAQDDLCVVGAYEDAKKATERVRNQQPDIILMDLEMPQVDGIQAVAAIKKEMPEKKIIILTTHQEDDKIFAALSAGADGYMVKGWPGDTIVQNIRHVHEGKGGAFTPEVGLSLARMLTVRNPEPVPRFFDLNKREREVLCELVTGKDYQRVADALGIKYFTVNHHLKSIYRKMGVNTRGEAVRLAQDHKICS